MDNPTLDGRLNVLILRSEQSTAAPLFVANGPIYASRAEVSSCDEARTPQQTEPTVSAGTVLFDLYHRGRHAITLPARAIEMGLPPPGKQWYTYKYDEPHFEIPGEVASVLKSLIDSYSEGYEPIWIQFGSPAGDLPLVPWERILEPALGRAVLRLPEFLFDPVSQSDPLDVVLCASSPSAKDALPHEKVIPSLVRRMLETHKGRLVIHIFTDLQAYEPLRVSLGEHLKDRDAERGVVLYDPQTARQFEAAERKTSIDDELGEVQNPWLKWILSQLEDRSVQAVHFICHGYLSFSQGALAFSESPVCNEDRSWARFVGARQLSTFLTRAGAWVLGLSEVQPGLSGFGVRMLFRNLNQIRAGTTYVHDLTADPDAEALASTYEFLFRYGAAAPPRSPAVSLSCPPGLFLPSSPEKIGEREKLLEEFTLKKGATRQYFEQGSRAPRWMGMAQRALEQRVAKLSQDISSSSMDSESGMAARKGVEDALRFMSDLLSRPLKETAAPGTSGNTASPPKHEQKLGGEGVS